MANIPAYLKSFGGGALGGAAAGSTFGPLGTGLGGLLGGGLGILSQYLSPENSNQGVNTIGGQGNPLFGYDKSAQQFPTRGPEQTQGINTLLSRGLANTDFSGIENYARKNFLEKTIPSLATRFSAFGSNALSSGSFQNQLGQHASDLDAQLAALKAQHGFQELNYGLQPTQENYYSPAQAGLISDPTNSSQLIQILSQLLSSLKGGQ